jgi:phosphate transport system substrate-binding protein
MTPRLWTGLVVLIGGLYLAPSAFAAGEQSKLTLNWVGCGISKKAYVAEIAKRYEEVTGVKIEISGGGATKGIRQVATGEADIGGSCRFKLRSNDQESDATLVPVAWDALAVIVHPDNPVGDLTLDQVRDIYLGKVTNWSQVGGPNAPLKLFIRKGKISGVGRTIRKLVFADYDQEFVANQVFDSSGPLEKAIEADVHAVGITGISSARKRNVKLVALNGKEPTYENIQKGDYLLYRPLYLAYNRNGAKAEEVKHFIQFVHGREGQEVLRRNGTVPYLEGIHLVRRQIKQTRDAKERGL